MSRSVWFEQVDRGLIAHIKSIVKLPSTNSEGVYSIPVAIKKPDDDFEEEAYPIITVYNLFHSLAKHRYDSKQEVSYRDIENKKIYLEKSALPYDLVYQIDFWSLLQVDMNDMLKVWLANTEPFFNLPVLDASEEERSCLVVKLGSQKLDGLEKGKRLFRTSFTYRICVEIDEGVLIEKPMITEETTIIGKE